MAFNLLLLRCKAFLVLAAKCFEENNKNALTLTVTNAADYIVKRARKRLYVLRVLMKSGLPPADLIQVYCNLVRPILEYASSVLAALPNCLVQLVESGQKSALGIIFPDCSYESALVRCGLPTLLSRRDEACRRFISNIKKESGVLSHLLPQPTNVTHGYGLRSGFFPFWIPLCQNGQP